MDIADVLNSQVAGQIVTMKMKMLSSAGDEIGGVAAKIAETGDPSYILELSPMALALFNQSSNK